MYAALNNKTGIQAVHDYLSSFQVQSGPDGLVFAPAEDGTFGKNITMPDRLRDWLIDLRLLRHIPISYLVPDAQLLPPESIRFFHVDPTWVDRLMDGVFSAANTGTVDIAFSCGLLTMTRDALDADLLALAKEQVPATDWNANKPMTGMLIRSELARRWPDMIVRAYTTSANQASPMPVLRSEAISGDLYIALFAGEPKMVHVREPNVGTRYGVEMRTNPTPAQPYKVDARPENGDTPENAAPIVIVFRNSKRVINLADLGSKSAANTPRQVALNLEQLPYVQEFKHEHNEIRGSVALESFANNQVKFRRNRFMKLDTLRARRDQQQQMETENP